MASGVKFRGINELKKKLQDKGTQEVLVQTMQKAVDFTKDVMVDAVETSGTDRQWRGTWARQGRRPRSQSGAGRVDTGEMRDSIKTNVSSFGSKVRGTVGWGEDSPEYTKFQEFGFNHYITGEFIEGMMALREGVEQGTEEAIRLFDEVARDLNK